MNICDHGRSNNCIFKNVEMSIRNTYFRIKIYIQLWLIKKTIYIAFNKDGDPLIAGFDVFSIKKYLRKNNYDYCKLIQIPYLKR